MKPFERRPDPRQRSRVRNVDEAEPLDPFEHFGLIYVPISRSLSRIRPHAQTGFIPRQIRDKRSSTATSPAYVPPRAYLHAADYDVQGSAKGAGRTSSRRCTATRSTFTAAGAKLTPPFPPVVVNRAADGCNRGCESWLLNAAGGKRFREIVKCLKPSAAGKLQT